MNSHENARRLLVEAIALIDDGYSDAASRNCSIAMLELRGSPVEGIYRVLLQGPTLDLRAIMEIRKFQGLSLKEAKRLVAASKEEPTVVGVFASREDAEAAASAIVSAAGGKAQVQLS